MIDIENVTVEQRRYKRKKNRKSPQSPPKLKKKKPKNWKWSNYAGLYKACPT